MSATAPAPAPAVEPCGYCPPGLPCTEQRARLRATRGACARLYTPEALSPVTCPGCHERLPLATANAGERIHPTCHTTPAEEGRP